MTQSRHSRLVFLLISAAGCGTVRNDAGPPTDASELFAYAINNQNIDAAMAHWSADALLYFQSGDAEAATVSRDEIRENYEHMFEEDHIPILKIRVDGFDQSGDIAHEWGSFKIGNSVGCYVLLRRAIDNWKIHREWIVEPCGH
jgi:ketosteroid isomerase-like protein